jgi:hypothetical protein
MTVHTVINHVNDFSAFVEFVVKGEVDSFRMLHGGIARQIANAVEFEGTTQLAITAG